MACGRSAGTVDLVPGCGLTRQACELDLRQLFQARRAGIDERLVDDDSSDHGAACERDHEHVGRTEASLAAADREQEGGACED